ncbi:hypothetical protein CAPTEDRAFT_109208 [Capitella teleta]|uniref:protein-tyrosine-phosphatase n=1 Tax=Capitella teleta TaxID=283909 RepID=R7U0K2_CAPTE|nr:hypothetical protein CAPTEDRAFT_109208 [Capitella teleta]|eukprot:ELT96725.1 hypothetical protein CAPTEDRAFT_109208 [Capitella teleta]
MPFRFHLKRQRRYEVSSRKSYVVCVRLLDNRLIECTLTADSTGYDCLENLAQRVELNEIDFFGLRYVNKKLRMRWLDLEKPIKKQMDKHSHSPLLYFGVIFYIHEVEHLKDPMTRYQYFLQLKSDVIEGKLPCTQQQAVLLAAYSIQAEFGDHDKKQHTPDFFKDYVILPRAMTSDESSLGDLTQEVVAIHQTLHGISPAAAELRYLNETRQLESYGTEFYPTKDDKSRDYLLGVSYMGISVKDLNGRPSIYFRWSDIANLTQNKRTFGINGMGSNRPIEFHLDDAEIAKYVFKMCSLQHQFYKATHSPSPAM